MKLAHNTFKKSPCRFAWPFSLLKKFEPWLEELTLRLHRLSSSGIPTHFLTNEAVLRDNPNPFSRSEEIKGELKVMNLNNLFTPFKLFAWALASCLLIFALHHMITRIRGKKRAPMGLYHQHAKKMRQIQYLTFASKFPDLLKLFTIFLSVNGVILIVEKSFTSEFRIDFIVGLGFRGKRPAGWYFNRIHDIAEGSMDHFSVLAFSKGSAEFLHCFSVIQRQTVTRMKLESVDYMRVAKSFGFYHKTSKAEMGTGGMVEGTPIRNFELTPLKT